MIIFYTFLSFAFAARWSANDPSVAEYKTIGRNWPSFVPGNISKRKMWHSALSKGPRGVIVTFRETVSVSEFSIQTRRDCCTHRYKYVCLHVDDKKVACTGSLTLAGPTLKFLSDFALPGQTVPVIGQKFSLLWGENSNFDNYAQILGIDIDYDTLPTVQPESISLLAETIPEISESRENVPSDCDTCETGYSYEKKVILGDQIRFVNSVVSWEKCLELCNENEKCVAVAFQTKIKRCFLKSGVRNKKPVQKDNFIYSRLCSLHPDCNAPEKDENLSNTVIEAPSTLVPVTTTSSNGHNEIDPKPQQASIYAGNKKKKETKHYVGDPLDDAASYRTVGDHYKGQPEENIAKRTMWHSKLPTGERGIIVDFKKPVELEEFEILTRRDCCNHRYEFVCLYVDDLKVACTGESFYASPTLDFVSDYKLRGAPKKLVGQQFALRWPLISKIEDNYAQIKGIDVFYKDFDEIDECELETHECVQEAICQNKLDGYSCECPPGKAGDGLKDGNKCEWTKIWNPRENSTIWNSNMSSIASWYGVNGQKGSEKALDESRTFKSLKDYGDRGIVIEFRESVEIFEVFVKSDSQMLGVCLAADGNRVACLPDGTKSNAVRLIPDHKLSSWNGGIIGSDFEILWPMNSSELSTIDEIEIHFVPRDVGSNIFNMLNSQHPEAKSFIRNYGCNGLSNLNTYVKGLGHPVDKLDMALKLRKSCFNCARSTYQNTNRYDFNHETAICENTLGTPFRAFCECDLAFVKEISKFEKENAIGKNSGYRLKDCVKPEPPSEPVEPPVTGCCESETGLLSHFNKAKFACCGGVLEAPDSC